MNSNEFDEWVTYHGKRFSVLRDVPSEKKEIWRTDVLQRFRLSELKAATDAILRGEETHPNRFEVDNLPGMLARIVYRLRREGGDQLRQWEEEVNRPIEPATEGGARGPTMWQLLESIREERQRCIFEQLMEHISGGGDKSTFQPDYSRVTSETLASLDSLCDGSTDPRDHYGCLRCRDTGLLPIWSYITVRDVFERPDAIRWRVVHCACECCPHPDGNGSKINKWSEHRNVPRFNPKTMVPAEPKDSREKLFEWCRVKGATN
jgi:hypothetical protein